MEVDAQNKIVRLVLSDKPTVHDIPEVPLARPIDFLKSMFGADEVGSAANALQVAVSRLRRLLEEDGLIETRPHGYLLHAGPRPAAFVVHGVVGRLAP